MAAVVVPDSCFYIDALRAGEDPFEELARHFDEFEFATCGVIVLEVCRGVNNPRLLAGIRERFSIMPFVGTGLSTWERATSLAWELDRRGHTLPATDLVIAACALEVGAAVLTPDRHFRQIPGLEVRPDL